MGQQPSSAVCTSPANATPLNPQPRVDSKVAVPTDRLLTAKELAYHLGVSESWVYRAALRGEIPVVKVGKYRRFDYDAVREALAEHEE
jgi:excisionase family DNA binding protein